MNIQKFLETNINKWTGSAYYNICRKFDTNRFYYIIRSRKNAG